MLKPTNTFDGGEKSPKTITYMWESSKMWESEVQLSFSHCTVFKCKIFTLIMM